ncbi:hypothetical protein [Phytohabitans flavus]|nr:hypothetical protein [Phytohabitans flavus]
MAMTTGGLATRADAHTRGVVEVPSSVVASDGQSYHITNHLTKAATGERGRHDQRREYLLAWAGDESNNAPNPTTATEPDFLAIIDVTKGSRHYGKVVNTVTMDTVFGNEPHHLQYQWHKGDKVFAGGLLSDITYVFDIKHLPVVRISGVVPGAATPCGSVPDAYQVLSDGTAYGTYLGGPDVAGPCTYSDGQTRVGNGFGGSPGEIVRISPKGELLAEIPAASTVDEGDVCNNIPALPLSSCANPHGVAVREDLNRMVTGDFLEARNFLGGPPPAEILIRNTVRIFDISNRARPKLVSVSKLPPGPRQVPDVALTEPFGPMETAMPHKAKNRGAFTTNLSGVLYYAPDITVTNPQWRVVYDDLNAFQRLFPEQTPTSIVDGASWSQVSPDDRYLYRLIPGGGVGSPGDTDTGMLLTLDIRKLLDAGRGVKCRIDTVEEIGAGGAERDCPSLVSAVPIEDLTPGGAHWAAMDNFQIGPGGFYKEAEQTRRIAVSNYFLAATGRGGNHELCLFNVSLGGQLSPDEGFRDEHRHTPCVNFNRATWPHGATGNARPHGILFAVADADIR